MIRRDPIDDQRPPLPVAGDCHILLESCFHQPVLNANECGNRQPGIRMVSLLGRAHFSDDHGGGSGGHSDDPLSGWSMQSSLGSTIAFGLVGSMFFTLIVIPILYVMVHKRGSRPSPSSVPSPVAAATACQ